MGRIHPDAETAYFAFHPSYRELLRPFLSCFSVTRAFSKSKGPDRLECFYLKAEPFIAELIGLERELLLCYAPFDNLQARSIKILDSALEEDRLRLDPQGSVLVSDDPNTANIVRDFLVANPERAPIGALSLRELGLLTDANSIRSFFVEQFFRRDLFALESPLRTDTTFSGRTALVTELQDRFRAGQNSGLFGLRRIGKTSVLYALARRVQAARLAGTLYLDVSSPGVYQLRWWEVLQHLVIEACAPLHLERAARSRMRALSTTYEPKTAAGHFKADILSLAALFPGQRMLLLLDEIEHISFDTSPAPQWMEDSLPFWQTVRSVHQDTQGKLGFVIAGVNPHVTEADRIGSFDNPLFSTVSSFYLGPFDRDTTRDMLRRIGRFMGLKFEESLYALLQEEFGGHPFLLRQACSALAKHLPVRPAEITCKLFERERKSIALQLERNVRQILNVLAIWYPQEYETIRLLAAGDTAGFKEFAEHSAEFTQHVEGYGLVSSAREAPRLTIGLVKSHLAKQPARAPEGGAGDHEALLAEISRRRNQIEMAMRRFLREGLQFAEGKKAMDAALKSIKEERRAQLVHHSYDGIWAELYFDELTSILGQNFTSFQKRLAESKEVVLSWMNHVNRCRIDAHAKTLSSDDTAFLRVCFRRLEEALGIQ